MAASELKPVYLITGNDVPKIERALERLRARFDPASVEELDAETVSGDDAVAAANALGLFGGGERLVIVARVGRWGKEDVDAIGRHAADATPGGVLALVRVPDPVPHDPRRDPLRLPAGLAELVERSGGLVRLDLPTRSKGRQEVADYAGWVRSEFERLECRADRAAADRLVELVGEDVLALRSEVAKLAAWANGDSIGTREVELLVAPEPEASSFALVDGWGNRNLAAALVACETMMHRGDEPFVLAARLGDHVARVRAVAALLDQDMGVREIAQQLGSKEFPVRKQAGQTENFSRAELAAAVARVADLDYRLKGGSRVSAELELERALVDITRRREHRDS